MQIINDAYRLLFGCSPSPDLKIWEVAEKVLDHFDGSKTGDDFGRDVLETIITGVVFPNRETTVKIVGRAEEMLPEFSGDYSPIKEVHMADVERVMCLRMTGKEGVS